MFAEHIRNFTNPNILRPLKDLDVPEHYKRPLKDFGITYLGELVCNPAQNLKNIRMIGANVIDTFETALKNFGLELPAQRYINAEIGLQHRGEDLSIARLAKTPICFVGHIPDEEKLARLKTLMEMATPLLSTLPSRDDLATEIKINVPHFAITVNVSPKTEMARAFMAANKLDTLALSLELHEIFKHHAAKAARQMKHSAESVAAPKVE